MSEKRRAFFSGLPRRAIGDAAIGLAAGALWWLTYWPLGISPLGAALAAANAAAAVLLGAALDAALVLARGTVAAAGPGRIAFLFGGLVLAPAAAIAADRHFPELNPVSATPAGALVLLAIVAASAAAMAVVARLVRVLVDARRKPLRWAATGAAGVLLVAVAAVATPHDFSRRIVALPRPVIEVERREAAAAGRLTIVGVDGADWSILLPLLREGRLPGFARFFREGENATALVCESLFDEDGEIASPVVWTSLVTGFRPEEHGIGGWSSAVSVNRRVPSMWGVVRGAGLRSVILNVPGTYPPDPISGFMIAGMPLPEPVLSQVPGFFYSARPGGSRFARHGARPLERLARGARDEVRFSLAVPSIPDPARASLLGVSHVLVRHAIVEGLSRPSLSYLFPREETVGVRLARAGSRIEAVARHGATGREVRAEWDAGEFSPPLALSSSGLVGRLKALPGGADPFADVYVSPLMRSISAGGYGSDRAATSALEEKFGPLVADAPPWMPVVGDEDLIGLWSEQTRQSAERRAEVARHLFENVYPTAALRFVVFTETDRAQHALWPYREPGAYAAPPGAAAALRLGAAIPALYETVDEFLVRLFETRAPDDVIAVVSDHGFEAGHADGCIGEHRLEGVFLAAGPGVARRSATGLPESEAELGSISVVDVAPSLLHLMGFPVARGADGRVREEIVAGGKTEPRTFEIPAGFDHRAGSSGAMRLSAEADAQIRSLGYTSGSRPSGDNGR